MTVNLLIPLNEKNKLSFSEIWKKKKNLKLCSRLYALGLIKDKCKASATFYPTFSSLFHGYLTTVTRTAKYCAVYMVLFVCL